MSAAAAPARRPAQSQQRDDDPLWDWVAKGYDAFPPAFRRLKRCLIPAHVYVMEELWIATACAKGRPEWAKLTEEWFADKIGSTPQHASEALKHLEFRAKLIESRKSGRGKEYRVLGDRLSLIEERERRKLEQKAEPKQAGRGKFVVSSSQPMEYVPEQPVSKILIETQDGQTISYDASESQSILRLVAKAELEAITPVMVSSPSKGTRPKVETITGVMVSDGRIGELRELLTPIFLDLYGRKPDEKLLQHVDAKLKTATVEQYKRVVRDRLKKGRVDSGLFIKLAEQTADAAVEIARRQPKPPPPPKMSTFVPEPEHSTSPWAKIRAVARGHITPVEYANWFVRTRHGKLNAGTNELTVLVPDDIAAQMLKEEFELRVLRWAVHAGFPLNNVFFKAAEENS